MPLSIFQLVCSSMLLVFLLGASAGILYFLRPVGKRETNLLLAFFLGVLSLSLLHNLLVNIGIFNHNPRWYFIPIQYNLALGPLLFFFVKSRLYRAFHLKKNDFKHFILPTVQAVSYLTVGFRDAAFKENVWEHLYLPFGKSLEGFFFVVGFSFYIYFSYRFIRHKLNVLTKRNGFLWELDKVRRLKRMVKGLLLLFVICAGYIVGDFVVYQKLGINLYDIPGYTYIGDISFLMIVLWVSYYALRNAFFPSRHRLSLKMTTQKIHEFINTHQLYLDDELDTRKLSYYLKINRQQLENLLEQPLSQLLLQKRIQEVRSRVDDPKYRNYSLANIGLDVGFATVREAKEVLSRVYFHR